MAILCAICKKPILDSELYTKMDDRIVHLHHHGVEIKYPSDIKIGIMLKLKQFPVGQTFKYLRKK